MQTRQQTVIQKAQLSLELKLQLTCYHLLYKKVGESMDLCVFACI